MNARPTRVLLTCGEASGDLYAAALTRALRRIEPDVQITAFGGPRLAETGARVLASYEGLSVTGLTEALSVLPRSWRALRTIEADARTNPPDVFVAIDFPDFNFRLLPVMHRLGVPIVYYISPQLWAWRPGRLDTIRRFVTQMLVIFPFEEPMYERAGVPVEFVGHPLVELTGVQVPPAVWRSARGLSADAPLVALLPGSRPNEVTRMLPVLASAARLMRARIPDVQFVVARAPSLDDRLFAPIHALGAAVPGVVIRENETDGVLASSDVAITASGTATVQTALHATPMVIVYRVSPLTYAIGRSLVKLRSFGMVNLVAGRDVVTELIQDACTPERVAAEAISLLTDATRVEQMRNDLADVRAALGGPGASSRAAAAVLRAARSR